MNDCAGFGEPTTRGKSGRPSTAFLCVGFAFWAAFSLELLLVFFNDAVCHTSVKDTMKQHKSGKSSINVSVWIDDVDSWADNLRINLCIYIFFFSPFFLFMKQNQILTTFDINWFVWKRRLFHSLPRRHFTLCV